MRANPFDILLVAVEFSEDTRQQDTRNVVVPEAARACVRRRYRSGAEA